MGGNVIYLPQQQSLGGALGSGVSAGATSFVNREMEIQQKQRKFQHVMQGLGALKSAGSREKALEILTSGNLQFENIEELNAARRMVDDMYPVKDTTPHKVKVYNEDGSESERYVPQGSLQDLNDPSKAEKLLGPGATLNKPATMEMMYEDLGGGNFRSTRKAPVDQKKPGEFTQKELELFLKNRNDERQAAAAEQSAKAAILSASRENRNAETQALQTELAMGRNAQATLANAIGIKHTVHLDGSISIDAEADSEKAKAFYAALPKLNKATRENKGDTGTAVTKVLNEIGYKPKEAEKPAPFVPKTERGIGERIWSGTLDAADAVTGKTQPDPTKTDVKKTDTKSAETSYKTAEEVRAAYSDGKIDRATALKILKDKFKLQ